MKVFYAPEYVAPGYFHETTRKAGWLATSLLRDPIPGVELIAPTPASQSDLEQIHDPAYVEAVRTGEDLLSARSNGFDWDEGIWVMATYMAGGVVAAAQEALKQGVSGSLSTGMHHAEWRFGKGFCTFNDLVLAAHAALKAGAESVVILDCDAHHGGGTHKLIAGEPRIRQVDVAIDGYDQYVCSENCTVLYVKGRSYLETVQSALDACGDAPGLVLYNAGMDPYRGCPIGGINEVTKEVLAEREQMVFEWAAVNHVPIQQCQNGLGGSRLSSIELRSKRWFISVLASVYDLAALS